MTRAWGSMGWQKWNMTTSDIRLLHSSLNEPHFNKVTFVFCQGQLCFIWENISPVSKFQIFWIIPILSITFLSRNVCFITMKFIHTIWHSLLWHISLVVKQTWLAGKAWKSLTCNPSMKHGKISQPCLIPRRYTPENEQPFLRPEIFIHLKNPKSSSFFWASFRP